jgi:hypothetical protein
VQDKGREKILYVKVEDKIREKIRGWRIRAARK